MAASLLIEEESGTCTARFQHPHNGYYAGYFSPTSWSGPELRASYGERRDAPRAWQTWRTDGTNPCLDQAAEDVAAASAAALPAI